MSQIEAAKSRRPWRAWQLVVDSYRKSAMGTATPAHLDWARHLDGGKREPRLVNGNMVWGDRSSDRADRRRPIQLRPLQPARPRRNQLPAPPAKSGGKAFAADTCNTGAPARPPLMRHRADVSQPLRIRERRSRASRVCVGLPRPVHDRPWNCPIEVTRRSPCLTASRAHRSVSSVESVRTTRQRSIDSMSSDRRPEHVAGSGKIMRRNIVGDWPFPYQQKFALSRTEENHV